MAKATTVGKRRKAQVVQKTIKTDRLSDDHHTGHNLTFFGAMARQTNVH